MSMPNTVAAPLRHATFRGSLAPSAARLAFCGLLVMAAGLGAWVTDPGATVRVMAQAGPDWSNLLRAMAGLKTLMAVGAAAAVFWRLGAPAKPAWLFAYALAGMAMMAGPGLIWELAHIGSGALLLHAGLAATSVLLWHDPQVGTRLAALVHARRAALRG